MACLSMSIPAKKSSTKLFGITQIEDESTRVYLKRFDVEMLKVEDLIKHIASEALINGQKEKKTFQRELYVLSGRLLKIKQTIQSHIRVEEASTLCYGPPHFFRDKQTKRSLKWGCSPKQDRSPKRDNNLKRSQKKPLRECLGYPQAHVSSLNTTLTEVLAIIQCKELSDIHHP